MSQPPNHSARITSLEGDLEALRDQLTALTQLLTTVSAGNGPTSNPTATTSAAVVAHLEKALKPIPLSDATFSQWKRRFLQVIRE